MKGVAYCGRCGATCRVAEARNEEARLLRLSLSPSGLCANCAITEFLKGGPLREMIDGRPEVLRDHRVKLQIWQVLKAAHSDSDGSDIDWEGVIANWALPFPGPKKGRKRK